MPKEDWEASGVTDFDPKSHNVTAKRGLADLKVGDVYRSPSRTVTDAHFSAFQALSGDNHPIHYDIEFCRAHGHRGLLAHGFQVLAFCAVGAGTFPHMIGDRLIGRRAAVTIGRDAAVIERVVAQAGVPFERCATLEQAVRAAFALARPGDAILLSPACASLDMFRNYAHRAEVFVHAVGERAGSALAGNSA